MNIQKEVLGAILLLIVSFARAQTVEYIHTDALGSPVAVTNASGAVIERTVYEPYGAVINRPVTNGPGYTGHVMDAVTGLNYMQQRYYDPQVGRFLSNDPVTATSIGGNFNRYWYANNNPYKYVDPDGNLPIAIPLIVIGLKELIFVGSAVAVGAGAGIVYKEVSTTAKASPSSEGAAANDEPKASDRPAGPDDKRGSTGGPGAGKRFPAESPQTKADKEGVPCAYCGKPTTNEPGKSNSRERDHIDPKSRGGNNSPENERDSCRTCNRSKGARNPDEWEPNVDGE